MKKQFCVGPPEHGNPNDLVELWVEPGDLAPVTRTKRNEKGKPYPYLMVGFDTEFKTPDRPVTSEEVKMGMARSLILSYQFHAKTSEGLFWKGICCPERDQRISLQEFMLFVIGLGARMHGAKSDLVKTRNRRG